MAANRSPDDEIRRVGEVLDELLAHTERIPSMLRSQLIDKIQPLIDMVKDSRNPRVMIMGRRGSGKSSVINALFGSFVQKTGAVNATTGAARWVTCNYAGRKMDLLDTRGVQEGSRPTEEDSAASAEESLLLAIRKTCPDVIVFVVKAEDVDSAIEGDLLALEAVQAEVLRLYGTTLKILPVLNQCDKLQPIDVRLSETDQDPEKQETIDAAIAVLARHLATRPTLREHLIPEIIPVSALAFYDRESGEIIPSRDYRWNIELLALRISENLPNEAQLAFVRLARFRRVQRNIAKNVTFICAGASGLVAAEPIPVADLPIITTIQATLVLVIAYISGERLSKESVGKFFVGLGLNFVGGMALREVARALVKLLPVAGSVVSAGIAVAGTTAIGTAASAFYIERRQMDDVKRDFDKQRAE
ncbi:50S ribosome-binding GTPase [Solwaraspora sp. WMMD406]|uniref:GTPase n=1 Tax=Solwaraspora sp. WMMD406 TaxID=3016095 RepID=UPI0024167CF4|nr:GTPase [Solwaraspora sp. WMMD406]MDG4765888.1 50S ribosome-binding GTPase [Solwaraspora sp. WMMD406]